LAGAPFEPAADCRRITGHPELITDQVITSGWPTIRELSPRGARIEKLKSAAEHGHICYATVMRRRELTLWLANYYFVNDSSAQGFRFCYDSPM
jgi:hypothetical protein